MIEIKKGINHIYLLVAIIIIGALNTIASPFKIVLHLPANFTPNQIPKNERAVAFSAQDFIKGALIAADTLSYCSEDLQVYILESAETAKNPEKLKDTLIKIQPNVVIGSIIGTELNIMEKMCAELNIPIISSVLINSDCPTNKEFYQSNPNLLNYGWKAAKFFNTEFKGKRKILIAEWKYQTDPVAQAFYDSVDKDSLVIINCNGKGSLNTTFLNKFSPTENVVFIPTRSDVFCGAVVSQLQADSSDKTTLVALYPIQNNKSIGFDLWEKFSIHFITPQFINYKDELTKKFILKYRNKYNQEPTEFAFRGFDEILFAFHRFNNKSLEPLIGLHGRYFMEEQKDCPNKKINTYLDIIYYQDYKLNIK